MTTLERKKNEKRSSSRVQSDRGGARSLQSDRSGARSVEEEEDYGDYVTRCICEFKHDDGYMICCDECSVWQHVECMQVDPKNLPDNYLCELCEPRHVDKRRAQKIQLKKREDISDVEEGNKRRHVRSPLPRTPLVNTSENRKGSSLTASSVTPGSLPKKRKKRGKVVEAKVEGQRKSKRDKTELISGGMGTQGGKKQRKRLPGKGVGQLTSIQSLLTAASLLEDENEHGDNIGKSGSSCQRMELWNFDKSPWSDKYETAEQNLYTEPVRAFLVTRLEQLKSEAIVYTREEYSTSLARPHLQCCLADVGHRRKGVVAQEGVPQDELVIEWKGKIAVKHDILNDMAIVGKTSSLWKHKPCPFVYLYDKITNLDLCIDSRNYGNIARFIRRSCSPNAEVRHFFVSSELHFGVYALNHIAPEEEVTLPFDFPYDKCDYPVVCGCGQSQSVCLVAYGKHPVTVTTSTSSHKSSGGVATDDEYQNSRNQNSSLHQSHSHVFLPQDEDSNSSWVSSGSVSRKRPRPHPSSPHKGSYGPSRDVSSDSEEEGEKHRRKSLSREERKTEQVWRVFEKLEASAQRRRQHLSECSHESDPLSPSPLHPLGSRGMKDRRPSVPSRKAQMLSGGIKMRLSSVSSADPLSPYDPPSEAFSPPITPGLAPPPECHSPLLSPSTPIPHFHATPQLHPKYLFADFALPWKKAILRQWESEQQNGNGPLPRSYWANSNPFIDHHLTSEMMRPRIRGCLKHRWMKHYNKVCGEDDGTDRGSPNSMSHTSSSHHLPNSTHHPSNSGSDKENAHKDTLKLSHKKRVLLRWQGSEVTKEPSFPLSLGEEPAMSLSEAKEHDPPSLEDVNDCADTSDAVGVDVIKGRGSPLFEEFSDSEEFVEGDNERHAQLTPDITPTTCLPQTSDTTGDFSSSTNPEPSLHEATAPRGAASPLQQPAELDKGPVMSHDQTTEVVEDVEHSHDQDDANLSGVSDISLDSISRPPPGMGGSKSPIPDSQAPPTSGIPAGMSDISSDNMEESSVSPAHDEAEQKPAHQSELSSNPATRGEENSKRVLTSDSLQEPQAMNTEEAECSSLPGGVLDDVTGGRLLDPVGVAPLSPLSSQATPTKTPGKRKINLKEYRNRARKPPERKPSSDKASSPPPTTPGTPSFLSHSSLFTTSSLSPYTMSFQLVPPTMGVSSTVEPFSTPSGSSTQFEPVSPEDDDHTPKSNDASNKVASPAVSAVPPTNIPSGGVVGGVAPTLTYSANLNSGRLYHPYTSLQPTLSGVQGYVMEGGVWIPASEHAQDPRNRPAVGVQLPPGGLLSIPGAGGGLPIAMSQSQTTNMYSTQQHYYQIQQPPRPPPPAGPVYRARHPGPPPSGANYY